MTLRAQRWADSLAFRCQRINQEVLNIQNVPGIYSFELIGLSLKSWLVAALLAGTSVSPSVLAQPAVAEHHLRFEQKINQYVDVRLELDVADEQVELIMPTWTPGSYLIRDFSGHVERFRARSGTGQALGVTKTAKNRWAVNTVNASRLVVEYSVWAGELGVNSSWIENDFALLNGAGIFLFSEASRNLPQIVQIELPPDWTTVDTALPSEGSPTRYRAADYDELVDSPILSGNSVAYPFEVDGQQYRLVNQAYSDLWDGEKAAEDVSSIVQAVQEFWRVNPFDRPYLFLNVIADEIGGLEHDHSTVLLAGRWQMRYREDYVRWLSLLTHEFFHAWNVRRLRPRALSEYNYQEEVYTRELWIAEGITSYYDNLLLFRSGLIRVEEFLALMAREIHKYETTPGRQIRSAELASFDTWIKQYKPDANSINSAVSYYRKGSLIGFVTDTMIRKATDGDKSLDEIMREMYRLYGPGSASSGYPPQAFQALVESVTGPATREALDVMLSTVEDPGIDEALDWFGLQLDREPSKTAALAAGRSAPVDFGVVWDSKSSDLVVEAVLRGGSGAEAGLLPADEILAINGTRIVPRNLADRMLRLSPGETVDVLLSRHGRIMNLPVVMQDAIPDKYLITIQPDINRKQKQRMSDWLGVDLKFVKN